MEFDEKIVPITSAQDEPRETECDDAGMAAPLLIVIGVIACIGVYNSLFGAGADEARAERAPSAVEMTITAKQ